MQTYVSLEHTEGIGYLTFACDEPGKPPTLDLQVLDELDRRLDEIDAAVQDLRAVVLRSDSERYFIVGANINALRALDAESIVPWVRRGHTVFNRVEALPLPVVARIDGYTLGGGLELAMACDLIVASHQAKLGQPEANLGFVAGWGGTYRLPRRVGLAKAKELFFTGRIIEANAAYEIGLVDFVGDTREVDAYLASLFADIRRCSALAVSQMKKLVNDSPELTVEASSYAEAAASNLCISNPDTVARVTAFLESRKSRQ
jgi:enoyl-CoA hydratase